MNKIKFLSVLLIIFCLKSCAFHNGSLNSSITDTPMVHKDIAIGVSQTKTFLGMGGVSKDVLIFEARQNMIKNRPLVNAEQYNNTTMDIKTVYYLVGLKTKVTIISDVQEPKSSPSQTSYSDLYLKKSVYGQYLVDSLFAIGDSVFADGGYNGEIIGFEGNKKQKVRYKYTTEKGNMKTIATKKTNLFVAVPEYKGLKLGDPLMGGTIIGFGYKMALIKKWDETLYYYYYSE